MLLLMLTQKNDTERQYWTDAQYSRKETLAIARLPESLLNEKADIEDLPFFSNFGL